MIVTFTPNPSLDRTARLEGRLVRGGVNRLGQATGQPGGKGVNVARAAHLAGAPTLAVLPADAGDPVLAGLDALGLPYRNVPTGNPVRANLTLTEADGTTSKFNEPGAALDAEQVTACVEQLTEAAREADWVALCGSLPPGAPADWYPQLVAALRPLGVRIAVDTSDAPLQALAAALPEAAPDLIKPNSEELGQIVGADGLALEAQAAASNWAPVLEAARGLVQQGVGAVLVTLGGSGALLVTADGAWHATPPPIEVASTVGAGDSSLTGYLLAEREGLDAPERLRRAVAYGSGAAALPGSSLPSPEQTTPDAVVVTPVS
ncbi:1-phosphofructokinase family hexose kinase [Luteococcus peritonei]|uniref:1-phosphofructokinase family hexose kinase n=1 Tax=Luteococcus peritonei TaxID=88874 RepID=A0ABW4RTB5_9ACTN